ncbi:MAG: YlbF family regulator [Anaerolineae bacterium]
MKTMNRELAQAAQVLASALVQAKPIREYREATERMAADPQATALLDELQQVQAEIRVRQNNGGVTRQELEQLRELQSHVKSHPAIAAFMEAQLQAQAYLPAINRELSELLGVDFATLGRVSNCC